MKGKIRGITSLAFKAAPSGTAPPLNWRRSMSDIGAMPAGGGNGARRLSMQPPLWMCYPREAQSPFCSSASICGSSEISMAVWRLSISANCVSRFCGIILLDKVDPMRATGLVRRGLNIRDGVGLRVMAVRAGRDDANFASNRPIKSNSLDLAFKVAILAGLSVAGKSNAGRSPLCVGCSLRTADLRVCATCCLLFTGAPLRRFRAAAASGRRCARIGSAVDVGVGGAGPVIGARGPRFRMRAAISAA